MTTYPAEYVVVGYLANLFEAWADFEGAEWGEYVGAMHGLLTAAISVGDLERAAVVAGWFQDEVQAYMEGPEWEDYFHEIYMAQDRFESITRYWRDLAGHLAKDATVLEKVIAELPDWLKPSPDREPLPDPERDEYERLKAKFEGSPAS